MIHRCRGSLPAALDTILSLLYTRGTVNCGTHALAGARQGPSVVPARRFNPMALNRALVLALAGCFLLAFPGSTSAQTASGLRGVVLDKDGAPLPGATVLVTNSSLGVSQGAVTDAKGEFRIVPLPPGKGYTVKVSFAGMSTVSLSDIEVTPGRVGGVPVTLRPDTEMKERVRVVGTSDVVNTEQTSTSTSFSSEFIDSLPILGRNYQDVLALAPGVSDTDGDGNPNIHGARDTDVITLVDGVSTTNPYDGKRGQELNIESIQEIEVKTSGASAEFSRGQGGFVTIVTKSGGNEFEGSFKFYWRSNVIDGDGAGIDPPTLHGGLGEVGLRDLKFNDFVPFLSLSGPIKKDKAWYFFTAEYVQKQEPVNALTQAFVRTLKEKRIFGKASWDVSTNHKLVFTATIDPQEYLNLGVDSFTSVQAGYTDKLGGTNLLLKETAVFSPNVFLESTVQHFSSQPRRIPTTDPDTNGNGKLFVDRNGNHFIDANERDPGQDFDRDYLDQTKGPRWDVFEDFLIQNNALDLGEDLDGDGRLTPRGACEGETREDIDCDGHLDFLNEDADGDGRLDPGEDRDGDGHLDLGIEDRNHSQTLDDRPFPQADDVIFDYEPGSAGQVRIGQLPPYYPYDRLTPLPGDLDYADDQASGLIVGPFFRTKDAKVGRVTLKEDLTVFVSDWHGQHDLKFGGVVERETYSEDQLLRPILFPHASPPGDAQRSPRIGVLLPAQNQVFNEATSTTVGFYVNDTFKPLPNLTIVMGVRFDREATDSFGYSPFDPAQERLTFDTLNNLGGGERQHQNDATIGNNDGLISNGYCSDPLFNFGRGGDVCKNAAGLYPLTVQLGDLRQIAPSRLTQHHTGTVLAAEGLKTLFPGAVVPDPVTGEPIIDRELLRQQGAATFQQEEPFRLTNNNLAPRLGVSWDPFGDSKTKVFANWSRFFDKLFLQAVTPEEGPDQILRYYSVDPDGVSGSGTPNNGIGVAISKSPPTATQVDRGLQTPFTDELTVGFERELAPEVSFKMTYINRKFRQQLQDKDINHTLRCCEQFGEPLDQIGQLQAGVGGGNASASNRTRDFRPDLYIYNFFFNQIFRVGNLNEARYHGLEFEVTKRLSRKWQLEGSYTYSRAVGDAEEFLSFLGDDPSSVENEFGYLGYDIRHQVKLNAVTYLPGDWQVGGTVQWDSGLPYSVISQFIALDNFDYLQFRLLYGQVERIDPANDPHRRAYEFTRERRNSHRNPPVYTINLDAKKAFVLGKLNSKLFITIENLLNTDDIRIFTYEPDAPNRQGRLQLDAERRFGRRFEVGFQFEF
jgi:outer membrane receptor protein involved in Fe transport